MDKSFFKGGKNFKRGDLNPPGMFLRTTDFQIKNVEDFWLINSLTIKKQVHFGWKYASNHFTLCSSTFANAANTNFEVFKTTISTLLKPVSKLLLPKL